MVASIAGSFLGIIAGGLLSMVSWRWVSLVYVPIEAFGTVSAHLKLKEIGIRIPARIDWLGNSSFAAGLALLAVLVLVETEVKAPMFRLTLFRIRPSWAGNLAQLLSSIGRGACGSCR